MADVELIWSYCIIAVGILGGSSNIIQFCFLYTRKEKSIYDATLISLSIADFFTASMSITYGARKLLGYHGMTIVNAVLRFSWAGCYFSAASSFAHMVFIAVQRLYAIKYPLRVRMIFTRYRMIIIMSVIWVFSGGFGVLNAFRLVPSSAFSVIIYVSGFILIVLYIHICHKIKAQNVQPVGGNAGRNKVVFIHSIAVTLAFIVCTFPYGAARFYPHTSVIYAVCDVMFSLNPFIDSVVYFLSNCCRRNRQPTVTNKVSANMAIELQESKGTRRSEEEAETSIFD